MKKVENRWPSSKNSKNLLFFAQTMEELLNESTWDNYRVYTLDTIGRLKDVATVSHGVENSYTKKAYLDDAIEEAKWSIERDPIAQIILKNKDNILLSHLHEQGIRPGELSNRAEYIIQQIKPQYKKNAENLLLERCFKNGKRKDIRHAACCYCSFLVSRGYNKTYIYNKLKAHFFAEDHKRVSETKLKKFFEIFDEEEKEYQVYVKVREKDATSLEKYGFKHIQKNIIPKSCLHNHPNFFKEIRKKGKEYKFFKFGPTSGLDPYSARSTVSKFLSFLKCTTWLEPASEGFKWQKNMIVLQRKTTNSEEVGSTGNNIKNRKEDILGDAFHKTLKFLKNLLSDSPLDNLSQVKLLRSLNTYSLALDSKDEDTQLVVMWAALEALLTDPKTGSKIENYKKDIVAAISSNYIEKTFEAFYYELYQIYKTEFEKIVSKHKTEGTENILITFACIIALPQYSTARLELTRLVRDNPLALYKISDLHNKFSSKKAILKVLHEHERRINWQITRIYRARNDIVHSGRKLPYTSSLIINLNSYYRIFLSTFVHNVSTYDNPRDIEQTITNIYMEHTLKINGLKSDGPLNNVQDIKLLFSS